MLIEMKHVRQIPGEGYRRWFSDDYFDLYLWYDHEELIGFQLCYGKDTVEHSLTWKKKENIYTHNAVDDGESHPYDNKTPILIADGEFQKNYIAENFRKASITIDANVAKLVYEAILNYPLKRTKGKKKAVKG